MKSLTKWFAIGIVGLAACFMTGCATTPGGVAPSSTPLEGRSYTILGYTESTDSRICLFGIIPISRHNSIRDAIRSAAHRVGGDALIEVTVEGYKQYWILFSRDITRVEGIGIRFTK
ncbi:MAG: hypothetical protein WCO42_05465 [bacterium]